MNRLVWIEQDRPGSIRAFFVKPTPGRVIVESLASPDTSHDMSVVNRRSLTPLEARVLALSLNEAAEAADRVEPWQITAIDAIREVLYPAGDRDAEWQVETIEYVAEVLNRHDPSVAKK